MGMRFVKSEDEVVYSTEDKENGIKQHQIEDLQSRQEDWANQCSNLDWL